MIAAVSSASHCSSRTSCRMKADVRFWPKAEWLFALHVSAFDPKRTSASISCCGSEADFNPYYKDSFERIRCSV